jgi:hypothetical protein
MKKLLLFAGLGIFSLSTIAQTARVQAIHNSADAAADTVDVWLTTPAGSFKLSDNLAFREATPFATAPAGVTISVGIAPKNSTVVGDVYPGLSFNYNLSATETYILVAEGIVSPTGYSPATAFNIEVYGFGREAAANTGETDVLVHHGATDAPTVDVRERTLGATIVDDISYTEFDGGVPGYLELPTADYILDVQTADGLTTVASYSAPLATLSLTNQALVVVASGFLDPTVNSNGPAFGLWVALPAGGQLVELPAVAGPTARVQVIHNSADLAADTVDVYVENNGVALAKLENVAFRTATAFLDLPATSALKVAIAGKNSTTIADSIAVFNYNLAIDETYILVAEGIVSATGYSPATPFDIAVYGMGREAALNNGASETDVLVHHGATDAPAVDVYESSVPAGNIVTNASYGDFAGYLQLGTLNYTLEVRPTGTTNAVQTYDAPLATLNLQDAAIVVLASGFLDPAVNSNGPAFGLWVALPAGGSLIPLPVSTPTGISEYNQLKLGVYPNPVNDMLTIQGVDLSSSNVTIFDVAGKLIQEGVYTISNNTINVSGLVNGSYQIVIQDDANMIGNSLFIKY